MFLELENYIDGSGEDYQSHDETWDLLARSTLPRVNQIGTVSTSMACPFPHPGALPHAKELHIPHAHTADNVPAIVAAIEDHLQHHAACDKCVVLVESLTPSLPLLSKETVGKVLTCVAAGDIEQSARLLDPYASTVASRRFLETQAEFQPEESLGQNFLNYCIEHREYQFELALALQKSSEELGVDYEVRLIDLDSEEEQNAVHMSFAKLKTDLYSLDSLLTRTWEGEEKDDIFEALKEHAVSYIASTACIISPLRNAAMHSDIARFGEILEGREDTLLVALYGSGHIEVAVRRCLETTSGDVAIVTANNSQESRKESYELFEPNVYTSYAAGVAQALGEEFQELSTSQRKQACESLISDEQALRFVWYHAVSQALAAQEESVSISSSELSRQALIGAQDELVNFLEDACAEVMERGGSLREVLGKKLLRDQQVMAARIG